MEVYDTQLSRVEWCPFDDDAEVRRVTRFTVELDHPQYHNVILTTIYEGDQPVHRSLTDTDHIFAPSTSPYRVIIIKNRRYIDEPSTTSTVYRVPTELSDFIKLPGARKHVDSMITSIQALMQHLQVRDVVVIIIVLSTRAHHVLDYARYCGDY